MTLDLNKLENKLNEALENETSETLTKFMTDKKMNNKNQSSIDWLIKEFSEILGPVKTTAMQDLFLVDAVQKAKAMHKEEIMDAFQFGKWDWNDHLVDGTPSKDMAEYYNETFE